MEKWKAGSFDQTSLAQAVGKDQTTIGSYLNGKKAGTLDVDEADAALRHIGSSLPDFLAHAPARELTRTDELARALLTRPELAELVEDLLPVPKTKLAHVIELARGLAHVASSRRGGRTGESNAARPPAPRTRLAPKKRREAPPDR